MLFIIVCTLKNCDHTNLLPCTNLVAVRVTELTFLSENLLEHDKEQSSYNSNTQLCSTLHILVPTCMKQYACELHLTIKCALLWSMICEHLSKACILEITPYNYTLLCWSALISYWL